MSGVRISDGSPKKNKIIVDNRKSAIYNEYHATVAELADAPDLGSGILDVGVQVSSVAPNKTILCGSGSVVERCLAKANVAGPNPVSRSKGLNGYLPQAENASHSQALDHNMRP